MGVWRGKPPVWIAVGGPGVNRACACCGVRDIDGLMTLSLGRLRLGPLRGGAWAAMLRGLQWETGKGSSGGDTSKRWRGANGERARIKRGIERVRVECFE